MVLGWSLGDPRIRETGVCKLHDGGVPQLSTLKFSFRMWGWEATHRVYLAMMAALEHVCKEAGTVPDPEFRE